MSEDAVLIEYPVQKRSEEVLLVVFDEIKS
jgi:hypothetical protein